MNDGIASVSCTEERNDYVKHMQDNLVFKIFIGSVYAYNRTNEGNCEKAFYEMRTERWKRAKADSNSEKLLCRICEQMVIPEKYMVIPSIT